MNLLETVEATCPNCWETISLTLDLSEPAQSYVEDCPVCCKPMNISYSSSEGELTEFNVDAA
jgi:Cysteine-rich CPXCG